MICSNCKNKSSNCILINSWITNKQVFSWRSTRCCVWANKRSGKMKRAFTPTITAELQPGRRFPQWERPPQQVTAAHAQSNNPLLPQTHTPSSNRTSFCNKMLHFVQKIDWTLLQDYSKIHKKFLEVKIILIKNNKVTQMLLYIYIYLQVQSGERLE